MRNTYILSQQQKNEIEALLSREPDLSDIPEITDSQAARLKPKYYKPIKKPVTFRIDCDNLHWLLGESPKGYQTRMNKVLRWARENGCPVDKL